jgi:corrinoid protein of di/trimethylamine methyltransferase
MSFDPGIFAEMTDVVVRCDRDAAGDVARRALDVGVPPVRAIEEGFAPGIRRVGDLWEEGEYFLPELLSAAEAMKSAMNVLEPALRGSGGQAPEKRGTVVIGTIQGDIHDIGKSLVAAMLAAMGFEVIDLGPDVAFDRFIDTVRERKADLLCMSALLTTTMNGQGDVIRLLQEQGLRGDVRVLVGGSPVDAAWAERIGADGYAPNAMDAVRAAEQLLGLEPMGPGGGSA